jgi:MoaA/NifB/PqqE/SkfB family radical SAM enzyme
VHYTEEKTLNELWNDVKFSSLREHIKNNNLQHQCHTCHKHIKEGNHVNVLSKAYDNDYPLTEYPSIMEFELDNTCNLACTMCNGMLSSTIRKDREMLPPLKSPYGKKFMEELRSFIPHLKEARFNGGEPFLIKIYYDIWDMILEINPEIKVTIATNGTVLNNKVKNYLNRGNFHLNISMDGFSKNIYESTRLNGDFDKLIQNFQWFRDYCHQKKKTLCIMINPMRQNWWEMPDFVNWCNENSVHLWFNTIVRPENLSTAQRS